MNELAGSVAELRSPQAIHKRCAEILTAGENDKLEHFTVVAAQLPALCTFVADVAATAYPDLVIPFHSRWRHFELDGCDRWQDVELTLDGEDPLERARTKFDLAFVSVLLDAGAGDRWVYTDPLTNKIFTRSEGLALASLELMLSGSLSNDASQPARADAKALAALTDSALSRVFQHSQHNPLTGVTARAQLLRTLGHTLNSRPDLFGASRPRPGGLYDYLRIGAKNGAVQASSILRAVLDGLGPIWPGRMTLEGVPLGDVCRHPAIRRDDLTDGLVPFHKLSQWLVYSLVEPIEETGLRVVGLNELSGLAEYRNGGLFIDAGVLTLKDTAALTPVHPVDCELVVEWRALTVALLDRLAPLVREQLALDDTTLPLVKVLQGGTWRAGRQLARQRRSSGGSPIRIDSDGTVF